MSIINFTCVIPRKAYKKNTQLDMKESHFEDLFLSYFGFIKTL